MRVIPILSQPSKINVFFNDLILQNCSLKYYSSFHSLMRDLGDIEKINFQEGNWEAEYYRYLYSENE